MRSKYDFFCFSTKLNNDKVGPHFLVCVYILQISRLFCRISYVTDLITKSIGSDNGVIIGKKTKAIFVRSPGETCAAMLIFVIFSKLELSYNTLSM